MMRILKKEISKSNTIFNTRSLTVLLFLLISFQTFGQKYCTLKTKTGLLVTRLYFEFEHVMYVSPNDSTMTILDVYPLNKIPFFSYEKSTRCIRLQPNPMPNLDLVVKYKNNFVDTLHLPISVFGLKVTGKILDKRNREIRNAQTLNKNNISKILLILNTDKTLADLIGLECFCNLKISLIKDKRFLAEYNYPLTNKLLNEIELNNIPKDATNILFQIDSCELRKPLVRNICWNYLLNCKIEN